MLLIELWFVFVACRGVEDGGHECRVVTGSEVAVGR